MQNKNQKKKKQTNKQTNIQTNKQTKNALIFIFRHTEKTSIRAAQWRKWSIQGEADHLHSQTKSSLRLRQKFHERKKKKKEKEKTNQNRGENQRTLWRLVASNLSANQLRFFRLHRKEKLPREITL
jgi:hypothetical protein